jgi:hypothetical protein
VRQELNSEIIFGKTSGLKGLTIFRNKEAK